MTTLLMRVPLLAAILLASACSSRELPGTTTALDRTSVVVRLWVSPAAGAWVGGAAESFNSSNPRLTDGNSVAVTVEPIEAGSATAKLTAADAPDAWLPDNPIWPVLATSRGTPDLTSGCTSVATSPLVIAMHRPLAEALGWPARKLGWLDISSLTADSAAWKYYSGGQYGSTLRFSHAHPGLAGSGVNTLLAVMQSANPGTTTLTPVQLNDPLARASLAAFESGVALFSTDTGALPRTMIERGAGYLGAAAVYESLVLGKPDTAAALAVIHPFEGTTQATFPYCTNAAASVQMREATQLFLAHLLSKAEQDRAVAAGLRPVDGSSVLDAKFDKTYPHVVFQQPDIAVMNALQTSWRAARKPANLVLLIDISGSMRGDKIERVRESASKFVSSMGDDDMLSIVTFSNTPVLNRPQGLVKNIRQPAIDTIKSINATGGTALYDAVAFAADAIQATRSSTHANVIVVLSDGKDTESKTYRMSSELIALAVRDDTRLYTIAYGADADKSTMETLAIRSNGSVFAGDTDNIETIYNDISTAFGGNVGIGR